MYQIGDKGNNDKDKKGNGDDNLLFNFHSLEHKVKYNVCNVTIVCNYSVMLYTEVIIYNAIVSDG